MPGLIKIHHLSVNQLFMKPKPYINCHIHTFTGEHVPPNLGKSLLPWPLGYIFTINLIVDFFRWWYYGNSPYTWQFKTPYIRFQTFMHGLRIVTGKYFFIKWPLRLIGILLTIDALLILLYWVMIAFLPNAKWLQWFDNIRDPLQKWNLLPPDKETTWQILTVLAVFLLVPSGRNLLLFVSKQILKFLKLLPGPNTKKYIVRYLSIGRFAFYKEQWRIFDNISKQYPIDTKFVILPMDMDYMDAGKPRKDYMEQLVSLRQMRNNHPDTALPFIFADPRRIADDPGYVQVIKYHIEQEGFRGIKTYPALGYYPFDKNLLEVLLYACENEIPVLNHCIRGVIFYRGKKNPEWNHHPVFQPSTGVGQLQLFQQKNVQFSPNFTHPLNYLVLLDETRLRKLLGKYNDPRLNALYGYTDDNTPLRKNLRNLKICFGHFGGEDEWARYLQSDRFMQDNSLTFYPTTGIDFSNDNALESIWKYASWYTIIHSLMLQYKNVYADISYILHDPAIFHLLKRTLMNNSGIADRVLFGTDFYVVRSQKSDKQMWTDLIGALSERELDIIAVKNPRTFLYNKISGPVNLDDGDI